MRAIERFMPAVTAASIAALALALLLLSSCASAPRPPTDFGYICQATANDGSAMVPLAGATIVVESAALTFATTSDDCLLERSLDFDLASPDLGSLLGWPASFGCPETTGGTVERLIFEDGSVSFHFVVERVASPVTVISASCTLQWER